MLAETPLSCVDRDFAIGEVEIMMPVGFPMFHTKQSDIEVKT